ncbi:AA-permease domain-containing protein [Fusarium sp. LHS14.1]|nr:AA-permease domain-containing protein [Fusarium sp. LHS14.1]
MSTSDAEKKVTTVDNEDIQSGQVQEDNGGLHRRVGNRQIQLFAIGGSIGTGLFVSIGGALFKAGPIGLLFAFIFYSRDWVDDALGFSAGFNFFCYQAISIPFEITAVNVVLGYWRDDIPVAAVCAACIAAYAVINVTAVRYYGEAEFWLSSGKVLLIAILYCFTFVTMITTGDLGRFEGFLAAIWLGMLVIVGPEYISMIAAEAERPRVYIKNAFKTVYWRFAAFFIGGALCVGIILPSNDPQLTAFIEGTASGAGTASASPYVIAMSNLNIDVLPHIINALLLTSIFSAGNTYVFCATRNLYSMALEGQAPKFLTRCDSRGVPYYCLGVTLLFSLLSFLQVSNSGSKVLDWLINLLSSGGLINFIIICITYIRFHSAGKAQGVDRKNLPYCGWFQPYSAWIALVMLIIIAFVQGYTVFLPGNFAADSFLTKYTMIVLAPITYFGWKLCFRSKVIRANEVDLVWLRPEIDAYEASLPELPKSLFAELREKMGQFRNREAESQ